MEAVKVLMKTTKGDMVIELNPEKAPITVENFLSYVKDGFFDGLVFHRVIGNFMIQGGGFDVDHNQKDVGRAPIKNEATNGLSNDIGTIAMARTNVINSATCQFFINVAANSFLNHTSKSPQGFGYCVFGKVVEGLEVMEAIKTVKTRVDPKAGMQDWPVEDVVINSVTVV